MNPQTKTDWDTTGMSVMFILMSVMIILLNAAGFAIADQVKKKHE